MQVSDPFDPATKAKVIPRLRRRGWRRHVAKHPVNDMVSDDAVQTVNEGLKTQDDFWESPEGHIVHWAHAAETLP